MPSPVTPVPRKPRRVRLAEREAQNISLQEMNKQSVTPPLSKPYISSKDAILSQIDDLSNRISDSAKKIKRTDGNISTEVSLTSSLGKPLISTPTGTTKREILGQMDELCRGIDDVRKSTSATKTAKPASGSVRLSSIPRVSIGNTIKTAAVSPSTLLPQSTIKARLPSTSGLLSTNRLSFGDSPDASNNCSEDLQSSTSRLSTGIPMFTTTPTTLMEKSVILKKRCDEYEKEVADLRIELDLALKKAVGLSELKQLQQESENENFQLKKELLSTRGDLKEISSQLNAANVSVLEATQALATKGEELNKAKEESNIMHTMLSDLEEKENELTQANIQIEKLQASIHEANKKCEKFDEKCEEIEKIHNDHYNCLENAYKTLQESHNEAVNVHAELEVKYEECLSSHHDVSKKHEEMLIKHKDLKEKHENVYTDVIPRLQSSLDEATQTISSLEADLAYSQEVNNDLSNANGQLEESHQNILNELSSVKLSLQETLEINQSLRESISDFERDSKSKTEEILEHQKTAARKIAEVEQLTEELIKEKSLKSQLQTNLNSSQEELSSRGNALEAAQEELNFINDTCEQVQKEYDALQSQHTALLQDKNKNEAQCKAVWADLEAAMSTIGELEDDIGKFRCEVAVLKDEKEAMVQKYQSEISSLKQEIEEGKCMKIEEENFYARYKSEIETLHSDKAEILKKHESEIVFLRGEIEDSRNETEEAIKKGKQVTESFNEIVKQMDEKDAKIEVLSTSYADLQREHAMEKTKMAQEKEMDGRGMLELQKKIDNLIESHKADVAVIQSEKEKLQDELNTVLSEALSMHTTPEMSSLEVELMETKKIVEEQRNELHILRTSNRDSKFSLEIQTEKFQAEITHLQSELDSMRSSSLNIEESHRRIESLNADLQESVQRRTHLEMTVDNLQEQLKKLNEELLCVKDQNTHLDYALEVDGSVLYGDSFGRASPSSLASSPPPLEFVSPSSPAIISSPQSTSLKPSASFPIPDQVETQKSSERIEIQTSDSIDTHAHAPHSPVASKIDEDGDKFKKSSSSTVTLSDTLQAHTTGVVGAMRKNFLGWLYPNAKDGTENLGQEMEAYYDEVSGRWIFPGEEDISNELPPPPTHPIAQPGQKPTLSPSSSKMLHASPSPRTKALNSMMAPPPMAMRAGSYSSFASISSHSSNQSSPSHQQSSRGPSPSFLFPPPTNAVAPPPAPNTRIWTPSITVDSSQNVMLNNINAEVTAPLQKDATTLEPYTATDVGSPVENSDSYEAVKNINAGINISDIGFDSRDENDNVDNNIGNNNSDESSVDYEDEPFESEVD